MPARRWRGAILFIGIFFSSATSTAGDVLIFAAASTAIAVDKVIHHYHRSGGDRVRASYASSGSLARQLDNGAQAGLFLSANTKWMRWVEDRNLLVPLTRTDLFGNRLVLVQPKTLAPKPTASDPRLLLSELGDQRLAMGDPGHVPVGEYAKAALTALGLWDRLAPRTVRSMNVRAALLLVERQEAAFGIIYRTDALSSRSVRILATFPADSHPPIRYGLALIRNRDNPANRRFYDFLRSAKAAIIFRRLGFTDP